jgi:hypothetical protein
VHQIKVRQPKGRKDSIQTVIQTSRRLDSFLYEEAQNLEVFFKYSKFKFKNQSNDTTIMQIQSAGRYFKLSLQNFSLIRKHSGDLIF